MAFQRKLLTFMFVLCCYATSDSKSVIEDILDPSNVKTIISAIKSFSSVFFRPSPNFKVNFLHYSRIKPDKPHYLEPGNKENLTKSTFDPVIPTKIIIHGFFDNIHLSDWMFRLKDELLHEGSYNIIIVDWSNGNGPPYSEAVKNAKHAGALVADLIDFLKNAAGADPKDFHLIGHSLGSQVASLAGHRVPHLGRISGLDPAGPSFYHAPLNERLDSSDAEFVDVIHTDSGRKISEGLGLRTPVGHMDFYPNGGSDQPGCKNSLPEAMKTLGIVRALRYFVSCDHFRSIEYFISSINAKDCQTVAITCRDWESFAGGLCGDCSDPMRCAIMGYHSIERFQSNQAVSEGRMFYGKTAAQNPYCLHQFQVVLQVGGNSTEDEDEMGGSEIILDMKADGKLTRFVLNERKGHVTPGTTHTYLVTSDTPLGNISSAFVSIAHEKSSRRGATRRDPGFPLKKIKIVPIEVTSRAERNLWLQKTVLCASSDQMVQRNHLLEFKVNLC